MSKAPRIRGSELVSALKKCGFKLRRVRGSHHFMRHPDGRTTVVPVHSGETIGPGLLNRILTACQLSMDALRRLL